MRRMTIGGLCGLLVASTALLGADFWEQKEYSQWTDKELQKLMQNSPWAKEVLVQRGGGGGPRLRGDPAGGAVERNGRLVPGGGGGRGGGGAAGSGGGRADGPSGPPPMKLSVRWNSAIPIKQAVIRNQTGIEGEANEEQKTFLGRQETHYVVSLSGLPPEMSRLAENTERLKSGTMLERKNKEAIVPESVEVRETGSGVTLFFMFPKADAITMADKEVEFVMGLQGGGGGQGQGLEVKRKFRLKDMVFDGELAL